MIAVEQGQERMLCPFMEGSMSKVGSRRLPAGAVPGSRGKCPARDGQAGCRSISCTPASTSACPCPARAPTVRSPTHTQPKAWCGFLTSHLYAQLCCNRGTGPSLRARKPPAGGSWRSRLVPVRAEWQRAVRQNHGRACSAPREDRTRVHRLVFPTGWSLVPATTGGTWQACRGQRSASTERQWAPLAAEVNSAVTQVASGQWLDTREATVLSSTLLPSKQRGNVWQGWC